MARPKKYHIHLTDEDIKKLKSIMHKKGTSRSMIRRCQILLDLNESNSDVLTHEQCAKSNAVCEATVAKVVKDYATQGLVAAIEYKRNPNSNNTGRKVDGRVEAKIIKMACGPVPIGHARWTLRLLADKLKVELEVPVGKDAIRSVLKKMNFSLTAPPIGVSHLKKMPSL